MKVYYQIRGEGTIYDVREGRYYDAYGAAGKHDTLESAIEFIENLRGDRKYIVVKIEEELVWGSDEDIG